MFPEEDLVASVYELGVCTSPFFLVDMSNCCIINTNGGETIRCSSWQQLTFFEHGLYMQAWFLAALSVLSYFIHSVTL